MLVSLWYKENVKEVLFVSEYRIKQSAQGFMLRRALSRIEDNPEENIP